MSENTSILYKELSQYKNDDIDNSTDFHEYGCEEIKSVLEGFDLQDWKALSTNWKNLSETEQVFLANSLPLWHHNENIADIQIEIAFGLLFSKNEKVASQALCIFEIMPSHFDKYPQKIKTTQHNYVKNKKETFFKVITPKPSILRSENAASFLKKHFTKSVFDRIRFLNIKYNHSCPSDINTSLTLIASKFLKKDNFELYEIIKNEFCDKEIPEAGSLPLIGNTNFIYAAKGLSGSFQLFWNEITSISIETRNDYYGNLQQGLCFSGRHHLFVPTKADAFDMLCKKLQDVFSIRSERFVFSENPNETAIKYCWIQRQNPNAHLIENPSFLEKRKWKKDSKKGFYIVHNGKWTDGDNAIYKKETRQLISWNTSIQELENLPTTHYKIIDKDQPDYKQLFFNRSLQIGPLLIADMYCNYPAYHNKNTRKEIWFEGLDATLHFEIQDKKAIKLLRKEFTNYFGKPKKASNPFVYQNNPHYTFWDIDGILISINLHKIRGIDFKIVNTRVHPTFSKYKEHIELSSILEFPQDTILHIQSWKESPYSFVVPSTLLAHSKFPKEKTSFVWKDNQNKTVGIYFNQENNGRNGISVFPLNEIKQLEITPVKSWTTDFCMLHLLTTKGETYKIASHSGNKYFFNDSIKQLEHLFECAVIIGEEIEDVH